MSKLYCLLVAASIIGSSTQVAAQAPSLLPQLDDPRLWLASGDAMLPPPAGIRQSAPPERAASGTSFAAGYVFGGLIGLRLGETATPPEELGLWLRGWYDGSAASGLSDRSSLQPGLAFAGLSFVAAARSHSGGDPPVVDGIVHGFLAALAITSGK